MNNPKKRIHAVDVSCNILDYLQKTERATLTEIADAVCYSKSTVHNHLQTLRDNKLLVREEDTYRLSLYFLTSTEHLKQMFSHEIIARETRKIADSTRELANFGVLEHQQIVYLYSHRGDEGIETANPIGSHAPLTTTALGKAVLSKLPPSDITKIIEHYEFPQQTENSITQPEELLSELETIREQGYAIDNEENISGVRCVAAPVEIKDFILGAISVSGPSSRISMSRIEGDLQDKILSTANVIEINCRHSESKA